MLFKKALFIVYGKCRHVIGNREERLTITKQNKAKRQRRAKCVPGVHCCRDYQNRSVYKFA